MSTFLMNEALEVVDGSSNSEEGDCSSEEIPVRTAGTRKRGMVAPLDQKGNDVHQGRRVLLLDTSQRRRSEWSVL